MPCEFMDSPLTSVRRIRHKVANNLCHDGTLARKVSLCECHTKGFESALQGTDSDGLQFIR